MVTVQEILNLTEEYEGRIFVSDRENNPVCLCNRVVFEEKHRDLFDKEVLSLSRMFDSSLATEGISAFAMSNHMIWFDYAINRLSMVCIKVDVNRKNVEHDGIRSFEFLENEKYYQTLTKEAIRNMRAWMADFLRLSD